MDIVADRKGAVYVTGGLMGEIDFDPAREAKGDTIRVNGPGFGGFVVKLDRSGQLRGVLHVQSRGASTVCNRIAIGKNARIHITGYRQSYSGGKKSTLSPATMFVAKYKKVGGKPSWTRQWEAGAEMHSNGTTLTIDSKENVLVSGFMTGRSCRSISTPRERPKETPSG